jgi:hypothetical protein
MKPVNNKSLLAFIFGQMEKLDNKEIDVETANSHANLAKEASKSIKYEMDRAMTLLKLSQHNKATGDEIQIRNVESITFEP